jgi:hypothetical protein
VTTAELILNAMDRSRNRRFDMFAPLICARFAGIHRRESARDER